MGGKAIALTISIGLLSALVLAASMGNAAREGVLLSPPAPDASLSARVSPVYVYLSLILIAWFCYWSYRHQTLGAYMASLHFVMMSLYVFIWNGQRDAMGFFVIFLAPDLPSLLVYLVTEPLALLVYAPGSFPHKVYLHLLFSVIGTIQWFCIGHYFRKVLRS